MKTAIIIHGSPTKEDFFAPSTPSPSNFQFIPWLQKQLSLKGIVAQTPEMPTPYNPVYEEWKKTFEQFELNEDTILIGHSCGGGFLVRWLSENKVKVGKVVLVEPWIDVEKELATGMFDFEIDRDMPSRTEKTVVMYGEDCDPEQKLSINKLQETLVGAKFVEVPGKQEHFVKPIVPEILEELGL